MVWKLFTSGPCDGSGRSHGEPLKLLSTRRILVCEVLVSVAVVVVAAVVVIAVAAVVVVVVVLMIHIMHVLYHIMINTASDID